MNNIVMYFVCSLTKVKVKIALGWEISKVKFRLKEVCKLRLENDPHDYSSKDVEQILQET